MELQPGTLLQGGKYKIEKVLGKGGFGITYLAEQTNLGRKVCIKEFFMKEYGERTTVPDVNSEETVLTVYDVPAANSAFDDKDATVLTGVSAVTSAAAEIMGRYREKFIKEAKTIARLDHPGIVRIHDVFEENGTAYYVMDFIEGENLNDLVKREGALSEERALGYIRQVADALSYVHGHNIMHLDVKPANVLVRKSDDKAILIDFGTAKQYDSEGTQTSTTPIGLSAGYAPIEMTKPGGVQTFSPETDVYSLGATLYYLVTGQNPPDASERMEMIMDGEKFQFPKSISSGTAEVIEQSMQARKKRIQNVNGILEQLNSDGEKKRLEAEEKAAKEAEVKRQDEFRIEREKADAEKKLQDSKRVVPSYSEREHNLGGKARNNKDNNVELDSESLKKKDKRGLTIMAALLFIAAILMMMLGCVSYDDDFNNRWYDFGFWGLACSLFAALLFIILAISFKMKTVLWCILSLLIGAFCLWATIGQDDVAVPLTPDSEYVSSYSRNSNSIWFPISPIARGNQILSILVNSEIVWQISGYNNNCEVKSENNQAIVYINNLQSKTDYQVAIVEQGWQSYGPFLLFIENRFDTHSYTMSTIYPWE